MTDDPWDYVPVPARKPGALRNGAPFKDWVLPGQINVYGASSPAPTMAIGRWSTSSRRFATMVPAVEAACAEAIADGLDSADVVLSILVGNVSPPHQQNIMMPAALTSRHAPIADCARHENLRRTISWNVATLQPLTG